MYDSNETPFEFICPISNKIMEDPVEMEDHVTYDKKNIIDYMTNHENKSPITKQIISTNMKPNASLKNRIQQFLYNLNNKKNLNIHQEYLMFENDSILLLKQNIEQRFGISITTQRLVFGEKHLTNNSLMMKDYKIINNSKIHLIYITTGG